jgi:hypothetical protein
MLRFVRLHNDGIDPTIDLPLAWRLSPDLWDADKQRCHTQAASTTKQADECHLNRLNALIEAASVIGEPLDSQSIRDIRHYGLVPTGRTVDEVVHKRDGRLITNAPTVLLTHMMNMWPTKTKRDPISDSVTPRKARILVMQGWNRWQILVMLRSFDPIPGKPVVVFDLFSGIGTGFLAAIDTPKITSAPRVTWISIEKDRDASWLH